jgi:hypothetical protein
MVTCNYIINDVTLISGTINDIKYKESPSNQSNCDVTTSTASVYVQYVTHQSLYLCSNDF